VTERFSRLVYIVDTLVYRVSALSETVLTVVERFSRLAETEERISERVDTVILVLARSEVRVFR
jgi:hypothetical protein